MAMRTPISRVRCATEWAITATSPVAGEQQRDAGEDRRRLGGFAQLTVLGVHEVAVEGEGALERVEIVELAHRRPAPGAPRAHVRRRSGRRRPGRARQEEGRPRRRLLPQRHVDQRLELLPQGVAGHDVGDDADHDPPRAGALAVDLPKALADRGLAGPMQRREPLVDDCHRGRRRAVVWPEVASRDHARADHVEVAGESW